MFSTSGENGRVLLLVVVTIFALSAFWFIALGVTGSELGIVGGKKSAAQDFYDAEAGLTAAMENFMTLYDSLSGPIASAVSTPMNVTYNGTTVATVTMRPISPAVTGFPQQNHDSCPSEFYEKNGSDAECGLYGITSVAGGKELQIGVYAPIQYE